MRWWHWLLVAIVGVGIVGALTSSSRENGGDEDPAPALSKHEQEIFDQQREVCKTEAEMNLPEFREQNGAEDPQRYAEYAAEHGFFAVRNEDERQAAIDGCLEGVKAAK
jgi:hypothetical protein